MNAVDRGCQGNLSALVVCLESKSKEKPNSLVDPLFKPVVTIDHIESGCEIPTGHVNLMMNYSTRVSDIVVPVKVIHLEPDCHPPEGSQSPSVR